MTQFQALLTGMALAVGVVLGVATLRPAEAQRMGPYQISQHSNTQAAAGVFRLDTATGGISYCYLSGVGRDSTTVVCTPEVR